MWYYAVQWIAVRWSAVRCQEHNSSGSSYCYPSRIWWGWKWGPRGDISHSTCPTGAGSGVQEGTLVTLPVPQTQTLPVERLWLQHMDHGGQGCLYQTVVYFTLIKYPGKGVQHDLTNILFLIPFWYSGWWARLILRWHELESLHVNQRKGVSGDYWFYSECFICGIPFFDWFVQINVVYCTLLHFAEVRCTLMKCTLLYCSVLYCNILWGAR